MVEVQTYTAQIFIGLREGYSGTVHRIEEVKIICAEYSDEVGLCVTISATDFIYTNGAEPGAIVGLINYPRFPSASEKIQNHAFELASRLKAALKQNRVSIVFPDKTFMLD